MKTNQTAPKVTITDFEVYTGTGRSWVEWQLVLDSDISPNTSLTEIVDVLTEHYGIELSWAQVIAVYYRWNGRRDIK